jgi:poly-gamma-glutamate capsule biosynthesis protein CapA/YwtB (metallophosphatase superfamily)
MEKNGVNYPARDILPWLKDADITHISNEISFNPQCPTPLPADPRLVFCSNPKYIALLETIGADVIDLTGNHLNDYGSDWLKYTLDLYQQKGMKTFAGGVNQQAAQLPAILEHHGNRFAFIGCNASGPPNDWATETRPGSLKCDYEWLEKEVGQLRSQGYLPIVTFQYFESYDPRPNKDQVADFRRISQAGAVIVSGSQAHRPQAMEFNGSQFIHYGLGNLFFDQMDTPWTGTRQEFIDRHIFYDGRYLGVELLTAMLEDYARPRPMTQAERIEFLTQMFAVSGW